MTQLYRNKQSLIISQRIWYKRVKKTSWPCMTSQVQFSRLQMANELSVTLCWQQPIENVRLVSDFFEQCSTLFNVSLCVYVFCWLFRVWLCSFDCLESLFSKTTYYMWTGT